jgi:hypothetical protein
VACSQVLAPQLEGKAFQSHGSYFIHNKKLYCFAKLVPFTGSMNAFELSTDGKQWKDQGIATANNSTFWPMDEPQRMKNGQWIMAGLTGADEKLPAIAIADDENILNAQIQELPISEFKDLGETTRITEGDE